jgi:alanine racemase
MPYQRWAHAEVDLGALSRNVRTLKALTPKGTLFMAVVKADGYGHGAVRAAEAALRGGADRLGVATVEEALALRAAGIGAPLHILSEPPVEAAPVLVEQGVIPTLFTIGFARALAAVATASGTTARYHLKVDTGMHRIGVAFDEAPRLARELAGIEGIRMEGTFTHFATADVPGDWGFEQQLKRFSDVLLRMKTERIDPGIVHAANSAATILHPETHFGMVRCGIAIYGLHPDRSTYRKIELEPAMSVKARLSRVHRVAMGEGVSYGFTWHAPSPTTIATLPLGYADGVHRAASNEMTVLVGGVRCPQVGRVCMDQFMVELPRRLEAGAGDEAVLVGRQGSETIAMDELAEKAGTINYEIACGFGLRLERRYVSA